MMVNNSFLQTSENLFREGACANAMRGLCDGLYATRLIVSDIEWKHYVVFVRSNPAIKTAYLCPFTRHAASRPFGYPGDATLIDHIYGNIKPDLSGRAKAIYGFTTSAPATRAVRFRRALMAQLIDRTLHERQEDSSILAIAGGHLRELELSRSIGHIRPKRFIALDQDKTSLAHAEKTFSPFGITTTAANIKSLIVGRQQYEEVDLIYSGGLYDYLNQDTAKG